jgi:hemerythrin-like domain-containing protein
MNPTEVLREEHRLILGVLARFESILHSAREAGRIGPGAFGPFLQFFRGFADRCHHGKEEEKLFPCLQRCGLPGDCGPIAVMLEEHRMGRSHVQAMTDVLPAAEAGEAAARDAFLRHGLAFLELLRHHIAKEDHVLFQIADQIVVGGELSRLAEAYREVEGDADYRHTYARTRAIADRLVEGHAGGNGGAERAG